MRSNLSQQYFMGCLKLAEVSPGMGVGMGIEGLLVAGFIV